MQVGIVGAGSIAFASAAFLEQAGHKAKLWSPSGERTKGLEGGQALIAIGALEGTSYPGVATSAVDVVQGAEALVIALPAYGHKAVFDAIAPYISDEQTILISSHASFGALYLSRLLAARGVVATIVAWGTTIVGGRQTSPTTVKLSTIRKSCDIATLPASRSAKGLAVCQQLFGDRFVDRGSLLAIALSNLNPQNHMGIALLNMTRMEQGETWSQGGNVTPHVGRLLEQLDLERLAIAKSLGLDVRTIFQHFHLSFHVPVASISEMNREMDRNGNGGQGPASAESRYVLEDVPFGLVATAKIGRMAGHPASLHEAGIQIYSAMYGRDFVAENDLLAALDLDAMTLDQLTALCQTGFDVTAERKSA